MKAETWVAIYAAVIGTSAFLLNLKTWFDSGVKLNLSLIVDGMTIGGGPEVDERDLIILYVTNRGDVETMITNMILFEFESWPQRILFTITGLWPWPRRWRANPKTTYVIAHPQLKGYPANVPSVLEPSKKWTGALRQRPDDDELADVQTGSFYTGVYASTRDRPYLIRIPKRQNKLPEGTATLDA